MMGLLRERLSARSLFTVQVLLMLLAGFTLACLLFMPIRAEVIQSYDEGSYYNAASDIRANGVLSKYDFAHLHSYLYPSLLAYGLPDWLAVPRESARSWIFILHAVMFFASAFYAAKVLQPVFGTKRALLIGAMICFNPFTLIYLAYSLTDSLSTTLTLALVVTLTVAFQPRALTIKHAGFAGLLLGAAVMTRPANIYLMGLAVPALFLYLFQGIRLGRASRTLLTCIAALSCAAVVCIPESMNRYRNFGKISPLIIESGVGQFAAARTYMKFVTFVHPTYPAPVFYRNPFFQSLPNSKASTLSDIRARILSTLVKMFGLVDQDFMRPYNFSLTSPDRWIGTVLSLSLFFIGAIGLSTQSWTAWKALWGSRFLSLGGDHAFALCSLAAAGSCFALYSQTMVESRFGLPILAIVAMFVPFAFDWWHNLKAPAKGVAIGSFLLFVGAGCYLSHWIQSLAVPIVQAWQV